MTEFPIVLRTAVPWFLWCVGFHLLPNIELHNFICKEDLKLFWFACLFLPKEERGSGDRARGESDSGGATWHPVDLGPFYLFIFDLLTSEPSCIFRTSTVWGEKSRQLLPWPFCSLCVMRDWGLGSQTNPSRTLHWELVSRRRLGPEAERLVSLKDFVPIWEPSAYFGGEETVKLIVR